MGACPWHTLTLAVVGIGGMSPQYKAIKLRAILLKLFSILLKIRTKKKKHQNINFLF